MSHRHHENHHRLIRERVSRYNTSGVKPRAARHEAYKKAHASLDGHLRCCHGWRKPFGPPLPLGELQAIHAQAHLDEQATRPVEFP